MIPLPPPPRDESPENEHPDRTQPDEITQPESRKPTGAERKQEGITAARPSRHRLLKKTKSAKSRWTCPTCGETHDAQFETCWKCAGRAVQEGNPEDRAVASAPVAPGEDPVEMEAAARKARERTRVRVQQLKRCPFCQGRMERGSLYISEPVSWRPTSAGFFSLGQSVGESGVRCAKCEVIILVS